MPYDSYKKNILEFYRSNRRMPSYSEIMDMVGFRSKNAVFKLLNKMVDDGLIEKDSNGRLSPKKLFGEVSVLGIVEAGIPTVAEEEILDSMSIDEWLIGSSDATFMLEVKGDSMIEAHIKEGDYVLVERTNKARVGDIVIANVDDGWTMKYLRKNARGQMYLEPANRKYKDIYPEYNMEIGAIVKAVIRKI